MVMLPPAAPSSSDEDEDILMLIHEQLPKGFTPCGDIIFHEYCFSFKSIQKILNIQKNVGASFSI